MKTSRRGATLIECIAAGAMAVLLLSVGLQFFAAVGAHCRALRCRQVAWQEAANVLERLAERPWDALVPEKARDMALSDEAGSTLPQGTLAIEIREETAEGVPSKRIAAEVRWQSETGHTESVRLVTWRYRRP